MTQTTINDSLFVARFSQKASSTSVAGAEHAKYRAGSQVVRKAGTRDSKWGVANRVYTFLRS